jgi:hypothetical protein
MPNRAEAADDREAIEGMKHICRGGLDVIVLESRVQTRPRRFVRLFWCLANRRASLRLGSRRDG